MIFEPKKTNTNNDRLSKSTQMHIFTHCVLCFWFLLVEKKKTKSFYAAKIVRHTLYICIAPFFLFFPILIIYIGESIEKLAKSDAVLGVQTHPQNARQE